MESNPLSTSFGNSPRCPPADGLSSGCLLEIGLLKNGAAQAGSPDPQDSMWARVCGLIISNTPLVLRIADLPEFGRCAVLRFGGSDQVAVSRIARSVEQGAPASGGPFFCLCFPIKNEHRYRSGVDGSRRFSRRTFRCFRHTSRLGSLSGRVDLRGKCIGMETRRCVGRVAGLTSSHPELYLWLLHRVDSRTLVVPLVCFSGPLPVSAGGGSYSIKLCGFEIVWFWGWRVLARFRLFCRWLVLRKLRLIKNPASFRGAGFTRTIISTICYVNRDPPSLMPLRKLSRFPQVGTQAEA